ncbi:MAG: rod shape-determining protein MreD [Spirochaetota bacterium]
MRRIIVMGGILLVLTVIQASPVYDSIRNAIAIKPDIVLIVIVFLGFTFGSFEGIIYGFIAGFTQDIISSGVLGLNALVYLNIGFLAGLFYRKIDKSVLSTVLFVFTATAAKSILYFIVNSFTYDPAITLAFAKKQILFEIPFNTVLSPVVFLILDRLSGLLELIRGGPRQV